MDCGELELTSGEKAGLCKRLGCRVLPGLKGPCAWCRHGANATPPGPGEFVHDLAGVALGPRPPAASPGGLRLCSHRGAEVGTRECPTCGNKKVKLRVYACPENPKGITYLDCAKCPKAGAIPVDKPLPIR